MLSIDANAQPYLKSLGACLTKVVAEGFTEEFYVTANGLATLSGHHTYPLDAFEVTNCFRFTGKSPELPEVTLLIVQASDGTRGTLVVRENDSPGIPEQLWAKCHRKEED